MRTRRLAAIGVIVLALAGFVILKGCNRLPSLENRTVSNAIVETDATRLGRLISPIVAAHNRRSGVYPLRDARDAFAARIRMAEAAERSLDVQYYIWHKDMSGTLLLNALRVAADRGVRVRLLLDDNNTSGLDETLAALDSHPNLEVRLFNPFVIRSPRLLGYASDFSRLNRRMHNKSFTADNQATIVGGRNVGDEYFGSTNGTVFADLDLLAIGPVVKEVSSQFDRYWASDSAYPIDRIVATPPPGAINKLAADSARIQADPLCVAYMHALRVSSFVRQIEDRSLPLEWTSARMIADDPAKTLQHALAGDLVVEQMKKIFGEPKTKLDLVSPYFVPASAGTEMFRSWASRGVKVRILTNSLEATDVGAVHAGYAKRRKALLASGIRIYELRRTSDPQPGPAAGSSTASLHAKTFAVDDARVFVGSFNFDPRSAELNTEMGFVVESPVLARRMDETFNQQIPNNAYEVSLSEDGELRWVERRRDQRIAHAQEPKTSVWRRAGVWFLSHLPIEWLL